MQFRADVFTWIPFPDVPNPLFSLPGGSGTWGAGACGPVFGGDDFITPPMGLPFTGTYRAMQSFGFSVGSFGDAPRVTLNTGCVAGTTTVLTAPRASGGRVCHALTATVKASSASVEYVTSDSWYRMRLHGAAQDPVPAAVAGGTRLGSAGAASASALTPNLEWEVDLRIQDSAAIPLTTQLRYGASQVLSMDEAVSTLKAGSFLAAGTRLVHGLITLRRFPSLVLYLTVDAGAGASTVPLYFADASKRGLGQIVLGQTDVIRPTPW